MSKRDINKYFPHDSNARNSERLIRLRMRHKAAGYGVYFMILERLREEPGYMSVKDYNVIAFDLREDASLIKSVVEDFGLFVFTDDGKYFYSESFSERMEIMDKAREKKSMAGKAGMANRYSKKAAPLQHCCNTVITPLQQCCSDVVTEGGESGNKKNKIKEKKIYPYSPSGELSPGEPDTLYRKTEVPPIPRSARPLSPDYDCSEVMQDFNGRFAGILPSVTRITEPRKKAISAMISEYGYDSIAKVFDNVQASQFLTGGGAKGWKADFDWIFRPANYVKILEGNYAEQHSNSKRYGNTRPEDFNKPDSGFYSDI